MRAKWILSGLLWSVPSALLASGPFSASTESALYDRVRGEWFWAEGESFWTEGAQGRRPFLKPLFHEGSWKNLYPQRFRNGYLFAIVTSGQEEDPGHLVVIDRLGKHLGGKAFHYRAQPAEDGSAVVQVESTWEVRDIEPKGGELRIPSIPELSLPATFQGTVVRSCELPSLKCDVDLYPGLNQPVLQFWPVGARDVLVSFGEGAFVRLWRGKKVWETETSFRGSSFSVLDVSLSRGEVLVGESWLGKVTVFSLERGEELWSWSAATDESWLPEGSRKGAQEALSGWCREQKLWFPEGRGEPFVPPGYPEDWLWRVAGAAIRDREAAILPNGDLLLTHAASKSYPIIECESEAQIWRISRETGRFAGALSVRALEPKELSLQDRTVFSFPNRELYFTGFEVDPEGNGFVCLNITTCVPFQVKGVSKRP